MTLSVLDMLNRFHRELETIGILDFCARAIDKVWPMSGCLWRHDRRRFSWICDKTIFFTHRCGQHWRLRSKRIVIFFTVKPKRKFTKQNKTKQKSTGKVWRKLSLKTRVKNRSKIAMASCQLSSEIEAGAKNRLSSSSTKIQNTRPHSKSFEQQQRKKFLV